MTEPTKTHYCFMLVFSEDFSEVLLLTKMKGPSFLLGKLTGVGGKLEPGESSLEAAIREFDEEAGIKIPAECWTFVTSEGNEKYQLDVFTATADIHQAKTNFDEEVVEPVSVHKVSDILAKASLAPDTIVDDLVPFIHAALAAHAARTASNGCSM